MDPMWFCDEEDDLDFWRVLRPDAQQLEEEHLRCRTALHAAETALRNSPKDESLKAQVEDLQKRMREIEQKAPWISAETPVEVALFGAPHG